MLAMYTRRLSLPSRSFLLLGPRGTGKTTWLRQRLKRALWYNLLLDRELLRLARQPALFRQEVEALPRGSWIVIDEVQKLPSLLNEVHDLIAAAPGRWKFALTGSSARRLRRNDVNLLAGRVISRRMFPLTAYEVSAALPIDDLLAYGMLPMVRSARGPATRIDLLEAYAETYLAQEIRSEALVRNLDSFMRFLEVAALANGQVTNIAGIARDAAVARPTVQGYFEVLNDTLIGTWLPAWRPRAKVKEIAHPKFFLFDTGVVRALAHRLREPLESAERGALLETLIFHELRAQIAYSSSGGELFYYRTPSGSEIDFIWRRGGRSVGIEVKASARWRPEFGRTLKELVADGTLVHGFGVYLGDRPLADGPVRVLPAPAFVRELGRGNVLSFGRSKKRGS